MFLTQNASQQLDQPRSVKSRITEFEPYHTSITNENHFAVHQHLKYGFNLSGLTREDNVSTDQNETIQRQLYSNEVSYDIIIAHQTSKSNQYDNDHRSVSIYASNANSNTVVRSQDSIKNWCLSCCLGIIFFFVISFLIILL